MRLIASLLRWLFNLIALLLILVALYVSLGKQLAPWLAEYRPEIELQATQLLGQPVHIGRIEGRWKGFAPQLVAHDVRLGEGQASLALDQVVVIVDPWGSLQERALKLATLAVHGLSLHLQETAEGRWQVLGLAQSDEPAPDVAQLLALKKHFGSLEVRGSSLSVRFYGEPAHPLTDIDLGISGTDTELELAGRAVLPDGQTLTLHVGATLDLQAWQDSAFALYLQLPQTDWAEFLPGRWQQGWQLDRLVGGAELWLNGGQRHLQQGVLQLQARQAVLAQRPKPPVELDDFRATLYTRRAGQGYQAALTDLGFRIDGQPWGPVNIGLTHDRQPDPGWEIQTPDDVEVGPLLRTMVQLGPLPKPLSGLLERLAPQGVLRNLALNYRPQLPLGERLHYRANLERIGFRADDWVPAIGNLSGRVEGNLESGELQFASTDFSLHLDQLFAEAWHYEQAGGRLQWHLDDEAVSLVAPYLQLKGDEGTIAGDFLIRLFNDPEADDYMDLRVGLSGSDVRYRDRYLPLPSNGLSPELSAWLAKSLQAGRIHEGYFQYQGSIESDSPPNAQTLSLYFDVEDVDLDYQAGWPMLSGAAGQVLISDDQTEVRLDRGRLLGSELDSLQVTVPHEDDPTLYLVGDARVRVVDALQVLKDSQLPTGETFAGWTGSGRLDTRVDLSIPLAAGRQPSGALDFSTRGARLAIAQADLTLTQLGGDFRYDTARGFSASSFQARALGHSVKGSIAATGTRAAPESIVRATGTVASPALYQWLDVDPELMPASGQIPYQLRLTLNDKDSRLQIDSSLRGTLIDLPSPLGKAADLSRPMTLKMNLGAARTRLELDYADLANLLLVAPEHRWLDGRAEVYLGDRPASLPPEPGLQIRGQLGVVDWAEWQESFTRYMQKTRTLREGQGAGRTFLLGADVRIGTVKGLGSHIRGLNVSLRPHKAGWRVNVDSQMVAGTISIPESSSRPLDVSLHHLRVPVGSDSVQAPQRDPLKQVDSNSVPAMNIAIRNLWLGGERLGAMALRLQPVPGGLEFQDLDFDLREIKVTGNAGWKGNGSWFKGRLSGGDLADTLTAWGFAPSVISERFQVDIDGQWPGSPAWFSLGRLSGSLRPQIYRGRFVEIEGGASALKAFGLLNFNAIGRRLRLDFSDLFSKGLSFDRVEGLLVARKGVYITQEPITLAGPSSNLVLSGKLDAARQRIDGKLLVTLPVSNNLPLVAVIAGSPIVGGALWVADTLLGDSVSRFSTVQYLVEGPLEAPTITFDKPFESPP